MRGVKKGRESTGREIAQDGLWVAWVLEQLGRIYSKCWRQALVLDI